MNQTAEVHEIRIAVDAADIDEMGHVNNVIYLRWVQEAAQSHWTARATEEYRERLLWVVLRHEIDYKQPAQLGDEVLARTWVGSATRVRFERFTELRRAADGALLAQARTVWCPIDAGTRKPTAIGPAFLEMFPTSAIGRL